MAISRPVGIAAVSILAAVLLVAAIFGLSQALRQDARISGQQTAAPAAQAQAPAAPAPAQPAQPAPPVPATELKPFVFVTRGEDKVPNGSSWLIEVKEGESPKVITGGPVLVEGTDVLFSGGKDRGFILVLLPGKYQLRGLVPLQNWIGDAVVSGLSPKDPAAFGEIIKDRIAMMRIGPNCTMARGCAIVDWAVLDGNTVLDRGVDRAH